MANSPVGISQDDIMVDFFAEVAKEFRVRSGHLGRFVGHRPSIGAYKEEILMQFLKQMFEPRFRILSGFFIPAISRLFSTIF